MTDRFHRCDAVAAPLMAAGACIVHVTTNLMNGPANEPVTASLPCWQQIA